MQVIAVIGANFGDEGKGLMTDYLAHKLGVQEVIRTNGGGQAAHTVQLPSGERHVFSHLASGTALGCDTVLGPRFILNPLTFMDEHKKWMARGSTFAVKACLSSYVTTPYDMLANQRDELHKQAYNKQHGSCGMGIFATLQRSSALPLRFADLAMPTHKLKDYLWEIAKFHRLFNHDQYIAPFLEAAAYFMNSIEPYVTYKPAESLVLCEGAQGLLLDQHNKAMFPHLTPTNTGLRNPARLAQQVGATNMTAIYVSRTYLTRHGAGPLPGEAPMPEGVIDLTNQPNKFQGALRYAPLDCSSLLSRVAADLRHTSCPTQTKFAFTCADQIPVPEEAPPYCYISHGPTRNDIKETNHVRA